VNRAGKELEPMPEKAAIVDLDQELWADYVRLRSQAAVAERHNMSQQAVSQAVARYLDTIGEPERREFRERCLDRLEDLYQAHRERALESPRTAALVRAVVMDQANLLGVPVRQLHVEHDGMVEHQHEAGPTVAELLDRWRAEGKLQTLPQAQLVRLDQDQARS
jgi:hypothetical protein